MSGFMDKLKAGAEQAKGLAGQAAGQAKDFAGDAASRAKEEAKELQVKRELGQAYDDLGKAAYELWEDGQLDHPHLESRARRVKALRDQLDQPDDDGQNQPESPAEGVDGPTQST